MHPVERSRPGPEGSGRRIYMVLGAFGNGGITRAMFNRAAVLSDAGHSCTILHLAFRPGFLHEVADLKAAGRLRPDIEVRTPFADLAGDVTQLRARRAPADRPHGVLGPVVRRLRSGAVRLLAALTRTSPAVLGARPPGAVEFPGAAPGSHVRVELSPAGAKEREVTFRDGKPVSAKFFDSSGRLCLEHVIRKTGRKAVGYHLPAQNQAAARYFATEADLDLDWFIRLAGEADDKPIFICDGPAAADAVCAIPGELAHKLVVLHDNHYASRPFQPGTPISPRNAFLHRLADMDALIVLTEQQRQDVIADVDMAHKIHKIGNCIPDAPVPAVERRPLRASMFGKLSERKGGEHAIRAFATVLQSFPEATLDVYGEGPDRAAWQRLIRSLGISRSVQLRGYSNAPATEMAGSGLVMFPSRAEASPMVIAECLLNETPVVAYNCKYGPQDLIAHNRDGLLVEEGDVEGLAASVMALFGAPDLARRMGRSGRHKARALYTEKHLVGAWNRLFMALSAGEQQASEELVTAQ